MPLEKLIDTTSNPLAPEFLYLSVSFPEPLEDRPYTYLNMVSTADGKIVIGEVGGSAKGVGGETDQLLFRRLQLTCDAAMIGGATLRSCQVIYPPEVRRFVVTRSGDLSLQNRFFTDAPDKAYILAPSDLPAKKLEELKTVANVIQTGEGGVDLKSAMRILRQEHGIKLLLCEGGAKLNDELLLAGLVDELFLTIAPKLKGGSQNPTVVDGTGFPPNFALPLSILSLYRDEDELYFRYKLGDSPVDLG